MKTNFDYLLLEVNFGDFAELCKNAELSYQISAVACVSAARIAMESAVKWLYSADSALTRPYDDKLLNLLQDENFQDIVPYELSQKLEYIRKLGNQAIHAPKNIRIEQAKLCLEFLYDFCDFISMCYGSNYEYHEYNTASLTQEAESSQIEKTIKIHAVPSIRFRKPEIRKENRQKREANQSNYKNKPIDLSEKETRTAFIDVMLADVGWQRNKTWFDEYPIENMPNKSGKGSADYVLFGDDGKPLAVIEAKRTSVDVAVGRQQAKLYADDLENRFGQRPIIFLTNGYETRIWDDKHAPERIVSGIYSKRDLEKYFNLMHQRQSLLGEKINDDISGRYYQKAAIQAVCDRFGNKRRKALLVMATGSGKTRTAISIVDVLMRHGWVKNVLFLADRTALVTQAKRSFHNMLPNVSLCNLMESKEDASARIVFSTYQTMMNCIDTAMDGENNRLFTSGHFDLIIVDEAHRSIYKRYRSIFTYFDALLVGLTATPKDEIEKNTYQVFQLEDGVPTYGYELAQAVQDGFLVDYTCIKTNLNYMQNGIRYSELTDDERLKYEETFLNEDGYLPDEIDNSELNQWVFNKDTIRKMLSILMEHGQKIEFGTKMGKTIIFAKNHDHAEKIFEIWNEEYPNYPQHYCRIIDNYDRYAQNLIDDFSDSKKVPQIAISVDMLDTGIDVPEVLNLVFFKKIKSKSKFWQMIGRGTRLCEKLIDGKDKEQFYIFDLCSNFDFFELNPKGREASNSSTLQEQYFNIKTELIYYLKQQTTSFYENMCTELKKEVLEQIGQLNRNQFDVRQHLKYISRFIKEENWRKISFQNTREIKEHIAPFILPEKEEVNALRFDVLVRQLELAKLAETNDTRFKRDLFEKIGQLQQTNHPAVKIKKEYIDELHQESLFENITIEEYEEIRKELRDLIVCIEKEKRQQYTTDFVDDILSIEYAESKLENDDLINYKQKLAYYIQKHQEDNPIILKLRTNIPLDKNDIDQLEYVLWNELGNQEQYMQEYGELPLGEFIRSIVGLKHQAVIDAFSHFMSMHKLNSNQMYFIEQVIHYIERNGLMKDLKILQQSPFNDRGSITELFEDNAIFIDFRNVIYAINQNAIA